jgi:hypothetical protein
MGPKDECIYERNQAKSYEVQAKYLKNAEKLLY